MSLLPSIKYFFINFANNKRLEYMSLNDPLERFENMSDKDRYEAEQHMLAAAFHNSFLIVTKEKTFDEVMERTKGAILAHDPSIGITEDELDNMMHYYIETEEYERCSVIKKLIAKKKKKRKNVLESFSPVLKKLPKK